MGFPLEPVPEPRGDLLPPPPRPPTAVGEATPFPAPERRPRLRSSERVEGLPQNLFRVVDGVLDTLDAIADTVRELVKRVV
ncbi:MAG: hypothetical protein ABR543_04320 [Gemmatimonadaceae bacterium]